MRYEKAIDLEEQIIKIAERLELEHIDLSRVVCVRSYGSKARRTLARCHSLSKLMANALNTKTHYVIEVITENFNRLSEEEKTKVLIHELLHIPKSFGGGFRHHADSVNKRTVDRMYKLLKENGNI